MTTTTNHVIVAGKIPTASAPLTAYTRGLIAGLTGNAHIPNPLPSIVTLTSLLGTFEAAETATVSRTKGTVGARNTARTALRSAIKTEVASIQAAADADPDNAEAIITSTSLTTRKVPVRVKAPFAVRAGAVSGPVEVPADTLVETTVSIARAADTARMATGWIEAMIDTARIQTGSIATVADTVEVTTGPDRTVADPA